MVKTLLLVDDEPDYLGVLSMNLKAKGYQALTASCGERALLAVKEQPVDVILLDVMMPGIDGFEVLRRLKAEPETKAIPVIMLSANPRADYIQKAKELGAADYVGKTIGSAAVSKAIEAAISPSS
jgi:diguanylate cyclase